MAVDLQLIADVDFALTEYLKPAISFLFIVLFNGFVELYSVDDYCQARCVLLRLVCQSRNLAGGVRFAVMRRVSLAWS